MLHRSNNYSINQIVKNTYHNFNCLVVFDQQSKTLKSTQLNVRQGKETNSALLEAGTIKCLTFSNNPNNESIIKITADL